MACKLAAYQADLLLLHRTASLIKSGKLADISVEDTQRNYKRALEKGVLKIMSKMGISLLSCYHGAQIFEIYGLGKDIVDTAFRGSVSRIGGMSFDDLQKEVESFWIKVSRTESILGLKSSRSCHAGMRYVPMMKQDHVPTRTMQGFLADVVCSSYDVAYLNCSCTSVVTMRGLLPPPQVCLHHFAAGSADVMAL